MHVESHDAMPGFIFAALSNSSLMKVCREGSDVIGNGHHKA